MQGERVVHPTKVGAPVKGSLKGVSGWLFPTELPNGDGLFLPDSLVTPTSFEEFTPDEPYPVFVPQRHPQGRAHGSMLNQ